MDVVLALDQGSSSSRALALDRRARAISRAQLPVATAFPKPGFVEHDALELARAQEAVLDAALGALPKSARVLAAGLAAQRSTVVLWNADDGRPVAPALSWQDGRSAALLAEPRWRERRDFVHERTGLYLTPYYSAPKIRWLLEHDPAVRALARRGRLRAGPVPSFLLWRLSRGEAFIAEPGFAQRMLLFNLRTQAWDPELLGLFGIEESWLPRVQDSDGAGLVLRRGGRAIALRGLLGDQQAAAFGQGAARAGEGTLNYGTGAFALVHAGSRLPRVPGLLATAAWRRRGGACEYFLEGTVHAAGSSFEWLKGLGLLKDPAKADALCKASTHRLFALSALGGLGAPRWDYETPTVYWGLRAQSKAPDIVRAATESIAFLIADAVSACEAAGYPAVRWLAGGGLSRMGHLMQFQADILQRAVLRLENPEATAFGAAAFAAEAALVPWAKALIGAGRRREFKPVLGSEEAAALREGWRVFVSAQQETSRRLRGLGLL